MLGGVRRPGEGLKSAFSRRPGVGLQAVHVSPTPQSRAECTSSAHLLVGKARELQCWGVEEQPLGQERAPLGPQPFVLCCGFGTHELQAPGNPSVALVMASGMKSTAGPLV